MIDTIILQTMVSRSSILKPERFNPPIQSWSFGTIGFKKFINNPTKEDKRKWDYLPKLTLFQRGWTLYLRVEFSANKILYGDDYNEAQESDSAGVVGRLKRVVEYMGVLLNNEQIIKAEVLGFHPSKNITLGDYYNSTLAIKELAKVDISRKFDIDCKEYKNGGEVLQLYSNMHALCFYDKVRDSGKPAKRAFDKDQTLKQMSLFDNLPKKIEILRMEARLKKDKFKDIFEKIGYTNFNPTFEDVFNKNLCQKILKYYWNYFFKDNLFLFDTRNSPQNILKAVLAKYKGGRKNLYKILAVVGFILCCKDEAGTIGVRNVIEFYKPKNNWSKTKKWLDDFKKDFDKSYLHGFIKDIETQLNEFEPVKLSTSRNLSCKAL